MTSGRTVFFIQSRWWRPPLDVEAVRVEKEAHIDIWSSGSFAMSVHHDDAWPGDERIHLRGLRARPRAPGRIAQPPQRDQHSRDGVALHSHAVESYATGKIAEVGTFVQDIR
jgi:hypothetical protein